METEFTTLEMELRSLTPVPVSPSLLDRLDKAMTDATAEISDAEEKIIVASTNPELSSLEESLRGLEPYGVPQDMISRLDEAMSRWHEEVPLEEKVIFINQNQSEKRAHWLGIRSVAAVALLGAGVAFLPTGYFNEEPSVADQRIPVLTNGNASPAVFTPNNARASVVSANDRGVVWTKQGHPFRCFEVRVNNELQFVNERGEKLILEQPKTEVRFTPVKFD